MNSEQVTQFVSKNKFPITSTNLQSRCVDGRPAVDEQSDRIPAISKPGGDIGDLMICFGALNAGGWQLAPHLVLSTILETYGGPNNIKFHTDSKAEEEQQGPGAGCGHISKGILYKDEYDLTEEQTQFIKSILPELLEEGAKQVVLAGPHEEKAVLVIQSNDYGVKPHLKDGDEEIQAFIYQETLHQQQLNSLVEPLTEKIVAAGQQATEQEVRAAFEKVFKKQLDATLAKIAKGKPVYAVQIQPDDVKVQAVGQ